MSTFFLRRKLILQVYTSRASLDHSFHQLKDIQGTAKTSLGVSDNGRKPIGIPLTLALLNLIRPLQSVINPPHHLRDTISGIEALVWIHLSSQIRIGSHLPTAQIN